MPKYAYKNKGKTATIRTLSHGIAKQMKTGVKVSKGDKSYFLKGFKLTTAKSLKVLEKRLEA